MRSLRLRLPPTGAALASGMRRERKRRERNGTTNRALHQKQASSERGSVSFALTSSGGWHQDEIELHPVHPGCAHATCSHDLLITQSSGNREDGENEARRREKAGEREREREREREGRGEGAIHLQGNSPSVSGDVAACPSARDVHEERRLGPAVLSPPPPSPLWVEQEAAGSSAWQENLIAPGLQHDHKPNQDHRERGVETLTADPRHRPRGPSAAARERSMKSIEFLINAAVHLNNEKEPLDPDQQNKLAFSFGLSPALCQPGEFSGTRRPCQRARKAISCQVLRDFKKNGAARSAPERRRKAACGRNREKTTANKVEIKRGATRTPVSLHPDTRPNLAVFTSDRTDLLPAVRRRSPAADGRICFHVRVGIDLQAGDASPMPGSPRTLHPRHTVNGLGAGEKPCCRRETRY
ncbi:hypothetical protein EYF80_015672 [Liparis tanakae]|uniref:Uncharacterized protein n=1 Tax=Liparis tanakae TaxID=230148 RepID=A0A4Z2I891_9TELE|nr:hypothetical protein EYF80_015672 [Liparis tanakae]